METRTRLQWDRTLFWNGPREAAADDDDDEGMESPAGIWVTLKWWTGLTQSYADPHLTEEDERVGPVVGCRDHGPESRML